MGRARGSFWWVRGAGSGSGVSPWCQGQLGQALLPSEAGVALGRLGVRVLPPGLPSPCWCWQVLVCQRRG